MSSEAETGSRLTPAHPDYQKILGSLTGSEWETRWKYNDIMFHQTSVDQELQMFITQLINRRENIKVFVPLCGKSLDMKWLADIGCTVVGVEISTDAAEQFFKESNLEYTTERIEAIPATLYKSLDNKNQIYCCNLYALSSDIIGQFNTVWDRASFLAINYEDVPRYVALLKSLCLPEARYILWYLNFDGSKYAGPPHCHNDEEVRDLFGDTMSMEKLNSKDLNDSSTAKAFKLDWLHSSLFLMVNKK